MQLGLDAPAGAEAISGKSARRDSKRDERQRRTSTRVVKLRHARDATLDSEEQLLRLAAPQSFAADALRWGSSGA